MNSKDRYIRLKYEELARETFPGEEVLFNHHPELREIAVKDWNDRVKHNKGNI